MNLDDIEQEPDKTADRLFGFPIVWTEGGMPVGDIVLADWPGWADWQRYLRRKEEEYEHEPE